MRGATRARIHRRRAELKRPPQRVETPSMKTCPHCSGEIRDSVIKCTHCGRSLAETPGAPGTAAPAPRIGAAPARATTIAAALRPAPPVAPAPVATSPRQSPKAYTSPPAGWSPPTSALSEVATHRAMPEVKRQFGPDMWMLWAGMAAAAAGILAYLAINQPWAHLTITQPATETAEAVVTDVTVRAQSAFVGTAGTVLAIALTVFGVLWFFYGFQRGWSIPGILSPALAILVSRVGSGRGVRA